MSSTACAFRNLIAVSICLCALLAFSTTLSADTTSFVVGQDNLGNYTPKNSSSTAVGVSASVGPYAGVLTINSQVQPNYLFFCLTGNQGLDSTELGTEASAATSTLASTQQLEEAAFLASYVLTEANAAHYNMTLNSTNGSTINFSQNGSTTTAQFINAVLGPIQDAIWYIMGTLPSGDTPSSVITDPAISAFVTLAQQNYQKYLYNNVQVFTYVLADNPGQSHGQSFISVDTLTAATPEPSTMVLFGAGGLLMCLGSVRRLLARRRAR